MYNVKCQMSKIKCQIYNVIYINMVKLLSERTSGVPPVIFIYAGILQSLFTAGILNRLMVVFVKIVISVIIVY